MPKKDVVAEMWEEFRLRNLPKREKRLPIESPCEGVIIAVGYEGRGILVDWPVRRGFEDPIGIEAIITEDLDDAGFEGMPDYPGIFRCTVEFVYDAGGYWVGVDHIADPEWTFKILAFEEVRVPNRRRRGLKKSELESG